ncbi:putative Heme peroxidase [Seiridium unicorne]|uniref:Heme peroxidase n=1 Tax=Seiridium unicorne TaxID=138068 RepID=A0ABR2UUU4_9PEZI
MAKLFSGKQEPPRPPSPSLLEEWTSKLGTKFEDILNLIRVIREPLPDRTDGGKPLDPKKEGYRQRKLESDLGDLGHLNITDVKTLLEMSLKVKNGDMIDDKQYLMEGLIKAASQLPQGSMTGDEITDNFLTTLWNDLQHPPQSMLGEKYTYRTADGSYNSLAHPRLGAANMPYARTVKSTTMQPGTLPDPGLIFDSIFARKDENREPHPNRISSMLFYVASIIIHDVFHTDHDNYEISQTSSYLDLAPLYGSNETQQKTVRTFTDGMLHPDCFADKRILGFPPGVSVLLIMFNRFHNYVAHNLAKVNENGRFTPPVKDNPKYKRHEHPDYQKPENKDKICTYELDLRKYDEDLFQTSRLITCGLYVNIILVDYVRTILNLNRTDSKWQLNPRKEIKGVPMGVGNQVSAEFNLVYRWHAAISERDEKWTEGHWKKLFPKVKDTSEVTEGQLLRRLKDYITEIGDDPLEWPVADGLARNPETSKLPDDDLVKIMTESIEDPANSFGANRVPVIMRAIEVLGMKQARAWGVGTLNELRKQFQLEPHRQFTDINPDPEVADQLRHLYGHPDLVEMYPGLIAESAKEPKLPGSGLCPSFTVSRAVLSDAVGLVRGDRFYTIDYHPKKLTNWGFAASNFDLDIDNGCVFYKLFARAFPDHFEANSVYAHYPLTVPKYMQIALADLGKEAMYNYDKPKFRPQPKVIFSYGAAERVLGDNATFKVTWGKAIEFLMGEPAKNFMLAGDGFENEKSRKMMWDAIYVPEWEAEVRKFYEKTTIDLLKEKSYKLAGKSQVDIVRDISTLVHARFSAELFMLPLKTKDRPGVFDEYQLYMIYVAVFICIFMDLDPGASFGLRQKAHQAAQVLGQIMEANVREIKMGGYISRLTQRIWPKETPLQKFGKNLIQRLLAYKKMDVKNLVWGHMVPTQGGMVPNQAQVFSQVLEYFLSKEGRKYLPEINRLAKSDAPGDFDTLMRYVLEAGRLNGEVGVFRYVSKDTTVQDKDRTLNLKSGDKILVNLRAASYDPEKFPNPTEVDLTRPLESYIHLGYGPHTCLGLPLTRVSLTSMMKIIGQLDGLQPVPGPQGFLQKRTQPFPDGITPPGPTGHDSVWRDGDVHYHVYLTEMFDSYFPIPTSLKVMWNGDVKDLKQTKG